MTAQVESTRVGSKRMDGGARETRPRIFSVRNTSWGSKVQCLAQVGGVQPLRQNGGEVVQ